MQIRIFTSLPEKRYSPPADPPDNVLVVVATAVGGVYLSFVRSCKHSNLYLGLHQNFFPSRAEHVHGRGNGYDLNIIYIIFTIS